MREFNFRTALNHKLQLDKAETIQNRCEARHRQRVRRNNRTFRKYVTIVAIDAALIGGIITAAGVLMTYLVV